MKNFALVILLSTCCFLSSNLAQKSFLSKTYVDVNLYQLSSQNIGIDKGISYRSFQLLQGIELGYFMTDRISTSLGYTNKDNTIFLNNEPFSIIRQSIRNSDEFYIGIEYLLPIRKFGIAVSTDFFIRVGDHYQVIKADIIPSRTESKTTLRNIGITPSIQFQYEISDIFSIRLGTAFSFSYQESKVTVLNNIGLYKSDFQENIREFIPLSNLSIRFRLAGK